MAAGQPAPAHGLIRVLFLIRSLNQGGTERQLTQLVRGMDKDRFAITVATFYDGGRLREQIDGLPGVRVASLALSLIHI